MTARIFPASIIILLMFAVACSSTGDPVTPVNIPAPGVRNSTASSNILGVWDVTIDPATMIVEAAPVRGAEFTFNVTKLLDSQPATLVFDNLGVELDTGMVELDLGIRHPMDGFPQYTGFDVIGVFMGDGPGVYLGADGAPVVSADMTFVTNADGYTRWFNMTEFEGAGEIRPLFGYVPGKFGNPSCDPASILNPYKYYADGLGPDDSAYDYITEHPELRGSFAPGNTNYRHYSIVFPDITGSGIRFQYAIVARWAPNINFPDPPSSLDDYPFTTTAPESLVVNIEDLSDVYYEDGTNYGGNAVLRISAHDWTAGCDGVQEEYEMWVYSDAWDDPFEVDMSCNGGAWNGSAYVADIPVTNVDSTDLIPVWIEVRYPTMTYSNEFGVPNGANGPLSTFHYYKVTVKLTTPGPCENGWADSWGFFLEDRAYGIATDKFKNVFIVGYGEDIWDGREIVLGKYDKCGNLKWGYKWGSTDDDVAYEIATDSFGNVYLTGHYGGVMDMDPGEGIDYHSGVGLFVMKFSNTGDFIWARTFNGSSVDTGYGIACQESGQVYVCGYFYNTIDLDPGDGEDLHTSNGQSDCFLVKLNQDGTYAWGWTWGDSGLDYNRAVVVDWAGNVYVTGDFRGDELDFDPGPGEDIPPYHGYADAFISHYDQDGNYQWTRTWGGPDSENPEDVSLDDYGNIYITGEFHGTVDFDPGAGVDEHSSTGNKDGFLTKLNSAGEHVWTRTYGSIAPTGGWTSSYSVASDSTGNCYVTGAFNGSLQLSAGGPPLDPVGMTDIFVARWNTDGGLVWGRRIGGPIMDQGFAVSVDSNGNPFVTGSFEDAVNFAPTDPPCNDPGYYRISYGEEDIFTMMMFPDGCW